MVKHGTFDKFFALLAKMPGADKEELVWQFSNMLTESLKEFHAKDIEGYRRMIASMQEEVNKTSVKRDEESAKKSLRSSILGRLQKHGIDTSNWARVNQFLENKRIAGKRLYEMDILEMRALIPKLESILAKENKIKDDEKKLTLMN